VIPRPGSRIADGRAAVPRPARVEVASRRRRLQQELTARAAVAVLILVFNEIVGPTSGLGATTFIRLTAITALVLNGVYWLAARTGVRRRLQAYARMVLDVGFLTVGLYEAGGLAAAAFLCVYAVIPVYAGITFTSAACLVATWTATGAYLGMVALQEHGILTHHVAPPPHVWVIVAFNLLIVNVVGGLTAVLAAAYRRSRLQLAAVHGDLERAHDTSLRMAEEVQRTARLHALGEVAAGVTHEIDNVLQAVFGHISLVKQKARTLPPAVAAHLDGIEHGCETAMRIVRNVLGTARHKPTSPTATSIVDAATTVAHLKSYDLRRDGIQLQLSLPPDLPRVVAPSHQMEQVLLNLVKNAQEVLRTAPVRRIEITGRVEDDGVVVLVRDTGPGIPSDVLPRLFEPFYTTKAEGTGLGLAVSAGIVASVGGSLTAANHPEGGALFRVALPSAATAPRATTPAPPSPALLG